MNLKGLIPRKGEERPKAKITNGVLKVTIPKTAGAETSRRKIELLGH